MQVRDGRAEFGCGLQEWAEGRAPGLRKGLLPRMARAIGATIPPLGAVADVEPVPARVDWGRWCADCPNCAGLSAEMVWLAGPHQIWCATCGNADIGGQWRPVLVPANHAEISAALANLPARAQNWTP